MFSNKTLERQIDPFRKLRFEFGTDLHPSFFQLIIGKILGVH